MPTLRRPSTLLVVAILLSACSGPIQRSGQPSAPPVSEFRTLSENPAAAAGTYAVLGGEILETRAAAGDGTTLLILHRPLSAGQRPSTGLRGQGRFAVHYPDFLDPHLFHRGQRVTVGGVVRGEKPEPGGASADPALWLDGREIQLWERPDWPLMTRLRNQKHWLPWWYDPYYGRRPWWW